MSGAAREHEVALADAFWAQGKFLSGPPPEFGPKARGKDGMLWDVTWPIANDSGIVESGKLRINYTPSSHKLFSINLIFRDQAIARLDFVGDLHCHSNPHWGASFSVPSIVCGPHLHAWPLNRDHILRQATWDIPCRQPIQPQIRRFDQALPWFAEQINLTLTPEQRLLELPRSLL